MKPYNTKDSDLSPLDDQDRLPESDRKAEVRRPVKETPEEIIKRLHPNDPYERQ